MWVSRISADKRSARRVLGAERKLQRDKRMRLVDRAAPSTLFYPPSAPLLFSLDLSSPYLSRAHTHTLTHSMPPLIHGDRGRNYYFLTSTSDLSSNDLSIEPRAGNHRTSANGTANGCVLLVPLHLPHYTQFSAGDLIGRLLSFFSPARSPLLPARSSFFFPLFVSRATIDRRAPSRSVAFQNFTREQRCINRTTLALLIFSLD